MPSWFTVEVRRMWDNMRGRWVISAKAAISQQSPRCPCSMSFGSGLRITVHVVFSFASLQTISRIRSHFRASFLLYSTKISVGGNRLSVKGLLFWKRHFFILLGTLYKSYTPFGRKWEFYWTSVLPLIHRPSVVRRQVMSVFCFRVIYESSEVEI